MNREILKELVAWLLEEPNQTRLEECVYLKVTTRQRARIFIARSLTVFLFS